jgi:hypothetical protein
MEIMDEMFWFQNFGPQWEYVKYVTTVLTQAYLLNYHLFTFTYKVKYICVLCVCISVIYTVLW